MFIPPQPQEITTESDVEQKFAWPLLTSVKPHGLGYRSAEVFTKPDIRSFQIGKGSSSKLYYPDYIATFSGLPVILVEAKKPGADLAAAATECRLYATELNACYPSQINPCHYCIVTDGITTEVRTWDSDAVLAKFSLDDVGAIAPGFAEAARILSPENMQAHAQAVLAKVRPDRFHRVLNLIGGQSAQNEQIDFNDFGRVLASNFQSIFDPASYDDRLKIVRNAYVASPRKERYISEIDRVIRSSSPLTSSEAQLIQNPAEPTELSARFENLPSLKNKILLLVGSVGAGKSTFVDYLRDRGLPQEVQEHVAWVRIDLNPAPVTKEEIYPWLRKEIIEGIRATSTDFDTTTLENLRKVYRSQVKDFEQGEGSLFGKESDEYKRRLADLLAGLKKDEAATIRSLEQFLCTGRGRLLVIVLDNCDKRDRDEQLLMFQVAKYIQQEIRCLVVLPLRFETYENHRSQPPLDTALKDLVYRIEPPPFQEVLSQRLKLVIAEAKRLGPSYLSYQFGDKTVRLSADKLDRFLHAMMAALFEHKQYGRNIIIGLAGWNIRRAFEIFLEFCRSGYIRTEEIFERQVKGDPTPLSHGVVAKVLLRTNRRYYNGDLSYVKNLFQSNPTANNPCPLLRYWILAWLRNRLGDQGSSGIKGYHKQEAIIRDLLTVGADPVAIREEIRYLAKAGCILPEHLRSEQIADGDLLALTPAGHVHLELAHRDFNYLAACAEDTWVSSLNLAEAVRGRVTQQPYFRGQSWPNMLANAGDLCAYMKRQQGLIAPACFLPEGDVPVEWVDFEKLLAEIEAQEKKFERHGHSFAPDLPAHGEPRSGEGK